MNSAMKDPPLFKAVLMLAAIAIFLLAMRQASEILAPILLAFVLAICTTPFLYWFMKKGASGGLALIITILIDVVIVVLIVWLVSMSLSDFPETISSYSGRINEIEGQLGVVVDNLGIETEDLETKAEDTSVTASLLQFVAGFAGGIVSGISNWITILMVGIFILVEATIMPKKIKSLTDESDQDVKQILGLNEGLRQYMIINAGVGALAGVLNTILLYLLGVEFAILWGLLSFFMSFIPSIGFLISVIPPAIMALLQFGPTQMLIVIGAFILINFLVDNVIKPRFIEEGVNISVTVTFISLIIWGWVLGPIGAILAVPMAIILQAVLDSREETRWLAYLMGSGSEPYNPDEKMFQFTGTDE
jgi:predicted PurR-regulated permease PerM